MSEMLRRRELLARGAATAGTLALGSTLAACGAGTKSSSALAGGGRSVGGGKAVSLMTFGVENDAVSMDYTQTYDYAGLLVVSSMTEQLLRMDNAGVLHPNLATSYDTSDPHRIVFKIRPDVRFHDGSPMTAEDVAFSIGRHMDPKVASLMSFYFANVERVVATGSHEVTIFLKRPDAQLVFAMSMAVGAVTSRAFVEKHGKAFGSPGVGTMGTGPYRFVNWVKGQSLTVERNDDYWNGAAVPRKVKTVTEHVISDETTLLTALRSGELDAQLAQVSGRGVASLASASNIRQYHAPCGGASILEINVARAPWNDARVRQALSLVIPRQGILDSVYGGQGILVKSITPPTTWSYARPIFASAYAALPDYTSNTGPTPSNVARARKLVSAAGAAGGTASVWVATSYDGQVAEAIQAAAAQIGLHLTVNKVTQAALAAASGARRHPYDMAISLSIPDFPDPGNLPYLAFRTNSISNLFSYSNPEVDALLNRQITLVNAPEERAREITQALAIVVRDQCAPMIVSPYTVLSMSSRLGGYQLGAPQFQWDCQLLGSISGS